MWIEKNNIFCHGVLDEERLEVPETKVCNFWGFGIGSDQNITGFEISMNKWVSQIVQITHSLRE